MRTMRTRGAGCSSSSRPADEPSRSSIDMHTAEEGVASTTQHHSAIMNLTLGGAAAAAAAGTLLAAARCTVADRAMNAPACVVQPYCLFIHWPSIDFNCTTSIFL